MRKKSDIFAQFVLCPEPAVVSGMQSILRLLHCGAGSTYSILNLAGWSWGKSLRMLNAPGSQSCQGAGRIQKVKEGIATVINYSIKYVRVCHN